MVPASLRTTPLTRALAVAIVASVVAAWPVAVPAQGVGIARPAGSSLSPGIDIDSKEDGSRVEGRIRGRVAHPLPAVARALGDPREWCAVALLHPNVKACTHEVDADGDHILLHTGPKGETALNKTYPLRYAYLLAKRDAQRVELRLTAKEGPLDTRDYNLAVDAIADGATTRIEVRYAYRTSLASRLATAGYLATVGSSKVGFTVTGTDNGGKPVYIGGLRGIVERNAVRQLYALEAHLDTAAEPLPARDLKRFDRFYALCDRFAEQLREHGREEYVSLKKRELERQAERQKSVDARGVGGGA